MVKEFMEEKTCTRRPMGPLSAEENVLHAGGIPVFHPGRPGKAGETTASGNAPEVRCLFQGRMFSFTRFDISFLGGRRYLSLAGHERRLLLAL